MSGQKVITEVASLKLKVFGQEKEQFYFRVRENMPMMIIKEGIALKMGVNVGSVTLLFDGRKIGDEATPSELELEDGDLIELYYVKK